MMIAAIVVATAVFNAVVASNIRGDSNFTLAKVEAMAQNEGGNGGPCYTQVYIDDEIRQHPYNGENGWIVKWGWDCLYGGSETSCYREYKVMWCGSYSNALAHDGVLIEEVWGSTLYCSWK